MLANGKFQGSAAGWTLAEAVYDNTEGEHEEGCAKLVPTGGTAASIVQSFGGPGSDPARPILVRLTVAVMQQAGICTMPLALEVYDVTAPPDYLSRTYTTTSLNTWLRYERTFFVPENTWLTLKLSTAAGAPAGKFWFLDDISLQPAVPFAGSIEGLASELRKRRNDWAAVKHPAQRYREIAAQAIGEAPMGLWEMVADESLVTVEDQRLYSLAGLPRVTGPKQAQRLFMADIDGHFLPIGRWEIHQDTSGDLVLALDGDPEGARAMRLEYLAPWLAVDPDDYADETGLDREWALCKGMTLLLMEASVEDKDPRLHLQELGAWDAKRQAREAQAAKRRRPAKARTFDWSSF